MKRTMLLAAVMIFSAFAAAVRAQETAELLNKQGLDAINRGAYESALRNLERAIVVKPDYVSAYYNLGTAYYYVRQFDRSIENLRHAIKVDPTAAASHNQLGVVYLESGDAKRAIAAFKEAIHLNPGHALANYNLGCAYIRSGDFKAASGSLARARQLDPGNAEIRLNLAYALSREKHLGEAIAEMETAVGLKPVDPYLQLFLGNLFLLANDQSRAADQYAKLKLIDPAAARQLYAAMSAGKTVDVSMIRR